MQENEALVTIANELEMQVGDAAELRLRIVEKIRDLILHDITRLTSLLYRIDVSERKLRYALDHLEETDSAELITDLILERQAEKLAFRKASNPFKKEDDIPGEEKW